MDSVRGASQSHCVVPDHQQQEGDKADALKRKGSGGNSEPPEDLKKSARLLRIDPVVKLPRELVIKIFSFLKSGDICNCCLVSRSWASIGQDSEVERQIIYQEIAFGALKWYRHFGLKVEEPPLPPDIKAILRAPCPFFPGKRVRSTHSLTLAPEGMTLETLESHTLNPKQGHKIGFGDKDSQYVQRTLLQYGKISSGRGRWIFMPNDVLPGSKGNPWIYQKMMAASYRSQGYGILSLIDGTICFLLNYVQTGKMFCSNSPLTVVRCMEKVEAISSQWPSAIFVIASGGLQVSHIHDEADESIGLGLARVLP